MTFCTGTLFMGVNLPEMLNQQCLVHGHSFNGEIERQVLCRFPQYYLCSSA